MKKITMLFVLVVLVSFISGCTQKATDTGSQANPDEAPSSWGDYVASGKPYECDVGLEQGEATPLEMKIYLKGNSVREEMTVEGVSVKTIFKENRVYTLNEVDVEKRDETLMACDWLIYGQGDTSGEILSEQFYDISFYEEIGLATYTCALANFGNEKFDVPGKVCDVSTLMSSWDE